MRHRRLLRQRSGIELDEVAQVMLDLLPASVRKAKTLGGEPTEPWLRGFDSPARHEAWLSDMLGKLRSSGLSDRAAALELRALLAAVHRMPSLSAPRFVDMLEALRNGPASRLRKLRALMDAFADGDGTRAESIAFVQWLMHKQFGDVGAARLELDALVRHVPGFGDPVERSALLAFQRSYDGARRRMRPAHARQAFATRLATGPGEDPRVLDLRAIRSSFPIYDAIVRDPPGSTRFASLSDGDLGQLVGRGGQIDAFFTPDPAQMSEVCAALVDAASRGVPGIGFLRGLSLERARAEIASRAVLWVHPESMLAARGVLASRGDFAGLLDEFRAITGRMDAGPAELLDVVQPAVAIA